MGLIHFVKKHKVGFAVGGIVLALNLYLQRDLFYPVVKGKVISEVSIPRDIPKKSQETYPYWVDIQTEKQGILRLNFNTKDISYDNVNHRELSGLFIQIGRMDDFEGKALNLEERIQIGDNIKVKVTRRYGQERNVRSIKAIYK